MCKKKKKYLKKLKVSKQKYCCNIVNGIKNIKYNIVLKIMQ